MSDHSDILQVEGINTKGFGILPKLVMQDERLSVTAKAIYGYFCSYAGAGKQAFPRVTRIMRELDLSRSTYYRHFNQLRDCGYIIAQQEHKNGKLSHNIYTLIQDVQSTNFQHTEIQDTENEHTQIQYTNINNSIENKQSMKNNNSSSRSIRQSSPSSQSEPPYPSIQTDEDTMNRAVRACENRIRENIRYEDFLITHPFSIKLLDEIVMIMTDVILSNSPSVRVDGENKPRELVRHVFKQLDYYNVQLVIDQFEGLTERVRKKRQYLITMLYNSRHETETFYANETRKF